MEKQTYQMYCSLLINTTVHTESPGVRLHKYSRTDFGIGFVDHWVPFVT